MNIYITKENTERLKSLKAGESMSGLVNSLLNKYWEGKRPDLFPKEVKPGLEEAEEEEFENDYYKDLIWEEATKVVWDITTGEPVEFNTNIIKELKKRGQVK